MNYKLWQEESDSAPVFTFLLRPRVIQLHQTCKLLCCLSGKPTPTVKWYKGNKELNKLDYNAQQGDGVVTMEIVDCGPKDSGKYRCVAQNEHGIDETTGVVIVEGQTIKTDEERKFLKSLTAEDRWYLETTIKDLPSPMTPVIRVDDRPVFPAATKSAAPPPTTNGTKAEEPSDGKRQLKPYGKKQDSSGGVSRSRSATKELELPLDDSLMHVPKFTAPLPATYEVKDGEVLHLKCDVTGDPEPQVTWFKDDQPLSSSDVIDLRYKQGQASLTINEVFPEDEGIYKCKATNSLGSVDCGCGLKVLPMEQSAKMNGQAGDVVPKVLEHLKSKDVEDGTAVTLSCKIGGASHFDVVWLHNNKEIKPSKDFQYLNENNKYSLKIAEIFPEDGGTYTCEAFNDSGETFTSCTIVVVGKTLLS